MAEVNRLNGSEAKAVEEAHGEKVVTVTYPAGPGGLSSLALPLAPGEKPPVFGYSDPMDIGGATVYPGFFAIVATDPDTLADPDAAAVRFTLLGFDDAIVVPCAGWSAVEGGSLDLLNEAGDVIGGVSAAAAALVVVAEKGALGFFVDDDDEDDDDDDGEDDAVIPSGPNPSRRRAW